MSYSIIKCFHSRDLKVNAILHYRNFKISLSRCFSTGIMLKFYLVKSISTSKKDIVQITRNFFNHKLLQLMKQVIGTGIAVQ